MADELRKPNAEQKTPRSEERISSAPSIVDRRKSDGVQSVAIAALALPSVFKKDKAAFAYEAKS